MGVLALAAGQVSAALVYDGLTGVSSIATVGSTPHTYMGQAFNIADPGTGAPVAVSEMRLELFVIGAQNFPASRLRVQFWQNFDPTATGTSLVYSNSAAPLQVFDTGPVVTSGNLASIVTLDFAAPVLFNSLTNLGLSLNWQAGDGVGNFADDTSLVFGIRDSTGPLTVGATAMISPNQYFRNAANESDFNFQAASARVVPGRGGIMFSLDTVPGPGAVSLLSVCLMLAARRRRF
jgi:hypothetical protein